MTQSSNTSPALYLYKLQLCFPYLTFFFTAYGLCFTVYASWFLLRGWFLLHGWFLFHSLRLIFRSGEGICDHVGKVFIGVICAELSGDCTGQLLYGWLWESTIPWERCTMEYWCGTLRSDRCPAGYSWVIWQWLVWRTSISGFICSLHYTLDLRRWLRIIEQVDYMFVERATIRGGRWNSLIAFLLNGLILETGRNVW